MFRKSDLLENTRIASPCSASWKEMEVDERVRHCSLCRLNVYNISEMSNREAEKLLRESTGRVCLRIYRRADGTVLTRDCPVGLRAIRRKMRLAWVALLGLLMGGCKSTTLIDRYMPDHSPVMGEMAVPTMCVAPMPTTGRSVVPSKP
jgi:hypothetical protein